MGQHQEWGTISAKNTQFISFPPSVKGAPGTVQQLTQVFNNAAGRLAVQPLELVLNLAEYGAPQHTPSMSLAQGCEALLWSSRMESWVLGVEPQHGEKRGAGVVPGSSGLGTFPREFWRSR